MLKDRLLELKQVKIEQGEQLKNIKVLQPQNRALVADANTNTANIAVGGSREAAGEGTTGPVVRIENPHHGTAGTKQDSCR